MPMGPELVSGARQRADELSGDASAVRGPLKGYHHETYVLPLPGATGAIKVREPREEILWFDRRCFSSEEELLESLQGHIDVIPDVLDIGGMRFQRFVEGSVLPSRAWAGRRLPDAVFGQVLELFRQMVRITPDMLPVERRCEARDRGEDGDTSGFLERLIIFMEERVYQRNLAEFGTLFEELGVGGESFIRLRKNVGALTERPFCLLHADLHRKNLIVDPMGRLWAIDWELAVLGDPLYDLATHLYLMRYPADQADRMAEEWCRIVERIRPGSSAGWYDDLPRLLDFKRAQSVFTDVIRVSSSLHHGPGFDRLALARAARTLRRVLRAAEEPLDLLWVPSASQIARSLLRHQRHEGIRRPSGF